MTKRRWRDEHAQLLELIDRALGPEDASARYADECRRCELFRLRVVHTLRDLDLGTDRGVTVESVERGVRIVAEHRRAAERLLAELEQAAGYTRFRRTA